MGDLREHLRRLLVERARHVPLAQIAREAGIDRSCLNLSRNRQRDLSLENIEKLRIYFGLYVKLTTLEEYYSISHDGSRRVLRVLGFPPPLPGHQRGSTEGC